MTGKLTNRTRTAQTYNLTNKVAPVRKIFERRTQTRDGVVSISDRRVVFPDSITILFGETSKSLPDGVKHCPEVVAALARRDVVWVQDPVEAAVAEPTKVEAAEAEPASDGEPATSRRRR